MPRTGKFVINKVEKTRDQCRRNQTTMVTTFETEPNSCNIKPKADVLQRLEFILSLLNRAIIGFITIYMIWLCLRQRLDEIPWHAGLCTLGFSCLMAEGMMAHYRGNAGVQLCQRPERTCTHWVLQLLGSIFGIVGILIKCFLEEVHFHTLHGQLGLAALAFCLLSLISGLSSFYATLLKSHFQPLLNKTVHNLIGLITFTLAMICMWTAFETEIFMEYSLDATFFSDFLWLLRVTTVLIWLLSSYGPIWCLVYSKLWKSYF